MDQTVKNTIEQLARAAHDGTTSFAAIVRALREVGVESYCADYRKRSTTYYLPTGETHALALSTPELPIPSPFVAASLQEAIRGSQRGELKYPDFVRRSMAAGCVGYTVWIAGQHVTYFGRRGEQHVESFPSSI